MQADERSGEETANSRAADTPISTSSFLLEMVQDRGNEIADKRERETLASSIKNLMTTLKFTVEQAMDALCIPMAQRQVHAGLVQQG